METKAEQPQPVSARGLEVAKETARGEGKVPSPAGSLGSPRTLQGPEEWAGAGGGGQGRDAGEGAWGAEEAEALHTGRAGRQGERESSARSTPSARRWWLKGSLEGPPDPVCSQGPGKSAADCPFPHWHCLEFPTANSLLHAERFSPKVQVTL